VVASVDRGLTDEGSRVGLRTAGWEAACLISARLVALSPASDSLLLCAALSWFVGSQSRFILQSGKIFSWYRSWSVLNSVINFLGKPCSETPIALVPRRNCRVGIAWPRLLSRVWIVSTLHNAFGIELSQQIPRVSSALQNLCLNIVFE